MADEDKEKAEKLAAAKKRFEQLKKEQKKGKKGGKKKESKTEDSAEAATGDDAATDAPESTDNAGAAAATAADNDEPEDTEDAVRTPEPSLPQQSKKRSESFRQGSDGAQAEVQDLYRKQAATIEQLEKENKAAREEQAQSAARLRKAEEELESLREGSSDAAALKTKARDAERLADELAAAQRQLAQAQQAAAAAAASPASATTPGNNNTNTNTNSSSTATADLEAQLASKTAALDALSLELSNARHELTTRDAAATDATERAAAAEAAAGAAQQELDALRLSISVPSDATQAAGDEPGALTSRIAVLESELRGAQTQLDAAATRAKGLEGKIAALTTLHREAAAAAKEKAVPRRHQRQQSTALPRDVADFELGDEETEAGALQARIRALEAENFDLRRGVWRERRAELQPGMGDEVNGGGGAYGYEDVDLDASGPYSAGGPRGSGGGRGGGGGGAGRQTSSFTDVITSGINAFTNRERGQSRSQGAGYAQHERKESFGLLSDDGFDEDAFRLAQEEEAKRRVERVKEVKRGLEQWRGWRVDLTEERRNSAGLTSNHGPVFEV